MPTQSAPCGAKTTSPLAVVTAPENLARPVTLPETGNSPGSFDRATRIVHAKLTLAPSWQAIHGWQTVPPTRHHTHDPSICRVFYKELRATFEEIGRIDGLEHLIVPHKLVRILLHGRALEKLACPRRGDPHRGDACAWRGTWGCQHSAQPPTTVSEQAYCVTMAHSPTAAHTKAGEAPCVAARKATCSRALTNPAVPCGCSLLGACARSARIECPCDAQC